MSMQKIKRVVIGGYVQADVTGVGEWLVGRIVASDKIHVVFQPADGSSQVKVIRAEAFKATEKDHKEAVLAANSHTDAPEPVEAKESTTADLEDADANEDDDTEAVDNAVRLHPNLTLYTVGGDDGKTVIGRHFFRGFHIDTEE